MRKRRVRIRTVRGKSRSGRRARQLVRSKAVRTSAHTECKNYVTETHYEL
jgi:hypothetical protein